MKDVIEANDAHRRNRENEGDRATLPATAPAGTGGGDVTESEPPVVRRRMHHPAPDFPVWVREFLEDKGAEVVMVVRDRHGHVWLHRKGHWRLPTGNLRPGEDPTSAVLREVREEFGAPLPLVARLGVLELEAHLPHTPAGARPFVAHFFLLEGGDHVPGPVPEEGIDAWRAVPLAELPTAAARLRALRPNTAPNGWMLPYWGAFRALEHEVASHFLIAYRAPGSSGRREPAPGTAEPGTAPPGTPPAPGTPPTGTADHAP